MAKLSTAGLSIDVRTNIKGVQKNFTRIQKQALPLATAKAMTFTAEKAQKALLAQIPQKFKNPIPATRKSVFKSSATVRNPTAKVFMKDVRGEYRWMEHHIDGGARLQKGSERRNRIGPWTAMGKDMVKNQYGNITKGRYTKMFADAQTASGASGSGDYASTKTKAKGGTKTIKYFKMRSKSGKQMIMWRKNKKTIIPALVETVKPRYRVRWPFYRIVAAVTQARYPELFRKSLAREVKKLQQPRVK